MARFQKGGFVVSFESPAIHDHFIASFSQTQLLFAISGTLTLVQKESPLIVEGEFVSLQDIDVSKTIQFVVNKTFNFKLSVFDPHAFLGGKFGTVTIRKRFDFDVPKRAEVASVSKTINVTSSGLSSDIQVVFAFVDPDNNQLFGAQNPTVWQVANFSKSGNNNFSATFVETYAIGVAQTNNGNLISADVWTDTKAGDVWKLSFNNFTYFFQKVTDGDPSKSNAPISIINYTGGPTSITLGTDSNGQFIPIVTQNSIGEYQVGQFIFTPILNAWVVLNYTAGQSLSAQISSPPLFGKGVNLNSLPSVNSYQLIQNQDKSYTLKPSSS